MDKGLMVENLVNYYSNGNKRQFANMLGVQAQVISSWVRRNTFDAELIYTKCTGVSADWLLSGKGDMIKSDVYIQKVDLPPVDNNELLKLCTKIADNYLEKHELLAKLTSMVKKE